MVSGKKCDTKAYEQEAKEGSKNAKPVTHMEQCERFFNFFSPPQVPDDDEELDEETVSGSRLSFTCDML